jgi:hypothetical protein
MSDLSFDELVALITEHFQKASYTEGLALADAQAEHFPEQEAHIAYLQMCLAARLGQRLRVLDQLQAMHEKGIWYSEQILRNSPSLKLLQGDPDYEALVRISLDLRALEAEASPSMLVTYPQGKCQSADEACPVLLALHANGEAPHSALAAWHTAAQDGWLVAACGATTSKPRTTSWPNSSA